jgi:hypothetical protein
VHGRLLAEHGARVLLGDVLDDQGECDSAAIPRLVRPAPNLERDLMGQVVV